MENKLYNEDIIAAISTPEGVGAVAIIRVSGKGSLDVLPKITNNWYPKKFKSFDFKKIIYNGEVIDESVIIAFQDPSSFTGEDSFEIQCHGGKIIPHKILGILLKEGVRLAEPGEFTKRAFFNEKFTLIQAETINNLIKSDSELIYKKYLNVLEQSGINENLSNMRTEFIDILSLLEASIDFVEEDNVYFKKEDLFERLVALRVKLLKELSYVDQFQKLDKGIQISIVGKPNAGKSSLLNLLLGTDKAIVHHSEGTTRDIIEDFIIINGIKITLFDTAGIRKSDNEVENIGIDKVYKNLKYSDFAIHIQDINNLDESNILNEFENSKIIKIINKIDTVSEGFDTIDDTLYISAQEERYKALIYEKIEEKVSKEYSDVINENHNVFSLRHKEILENMMTELNEMIENYNFVPEDILSFHLTEIVSLFDKLYGEVSNDDILDKVFSTFCIGK